jgi:hypothetical protein
MSPFITTAKKAYDRRRYFSQELLVHHQKLVDKNVLPEKGSWIVHSFFLVHSTFPNPTTRSPKWETPPKLFDGGYTMCYDGDVSWADDLPIWSLSTTIRLLTLISETGNIVLTTTKLRKKMQSVAIIVLFLFACSHAFVLRAPSRVASGALHPKRSHFREFQNQVLHDIFFLLTSAFRTLWRIIDRDEIEHGCKAHLQRWRANWEHTQKIQEISQPERPLNDSTLQRAMSDGSTEYNS